MDNQMGLITGETRLVGLIGKPVEHSLSPIMHNAALQDMNMNWCYLAMPCLEKDFKETVNGLRKANCKGLNITIPYKEKAIHVCDEVSPIAKKLGAVNTLIPNKKGNWEGTNTDIDGFLVPLKNQCWKGKKAVILGSGGSARAVLVGLQELNIDSITIVGRKKEKLNHFIADFRHENSQETIIRLEIPKTIVIADTPASFGP